MSGLHRNPNRTRGTQRPWRLLLGLLCILLVVVSGTVQAAHTHTDTAAHSDCSLCSTAHVVVEVSDPPVVAIETQVVTPMAPVVLPMATSVLSTFALFTRPPPAADIVPA